MTYILDDSRKKQGIIDKIAQEKGLLPFRVGSKIEDIHTNIEDRIQPPLEEWIRGFYDANFIVTDSFHACVFSILFKKPFVVIGNEKRGVSRFKSLLKLFGLEDRLIDEFCLVNSLKPINYEDVSLKLDSFKKKSMHFLSINLV